MPTKVKKWGNSYGIRLPKAMADNLGIRENSQVMLESDAKGIIIKKINSGQKFSLSNLVKGINNNNRHDEIDLGRPLGNELW